MKRILFLLLFIQSSLFVFGQTTFQWVENFDNNDRKWAETPESDTIITATVKDGHYVMDFKLDKKSYYFYNGVQGIKLDTTNFVLEAKIRQVSGPIDQGYGLKLFIYKDNSNYRNFFITSNGYSKISHFYSGKDNKVKDWMNMEKNINGIGQYNVFRVERDAQILRFYINDALVGYTAFNKYFADRIGFFVSGKSKIEVDYIKLTTSPIKINYVPDALEDAKPENMGSMINSTLIEKNPVISPDGKNLFFSRMVKATDSENLHEDIFYSVLDSNGKWSQAKTIGQPLNNSGSNSVCMVLPDNNTLLLMNTYKPDGSPNGGGISFTKRSEAGWEFPQNVVIEDYHNRSKYAGYALSPSGKVMILAAQRDETEGERDLYVSFKLTDTTWSKPVGLGKSINTCANEDSPFIAPDDKTLYFSSEGHPGIGGSDVFMTRRLDDTWQNWSTPKNLGKSVNSETSEFGFKIDAEGEYSYLYKSSENNKSGAQDTDIYRIKLSASSRPDPVVFVEGTVYNSLTNEPLAASIIYEDLVERKELGIANSEPGTGHYQIALPLGKQYGFLARKDGFYAVSENLDLTSQSGKKIIKKDLYLSPIQKGINIRLNNIFFEYDKADLKSSSFIELDRLVDLLKTNASMSIEISGHTDDSGSDAYNKTLSQKRASSVRDYLITKGISAERLTAVGFGEERPVADNGTEEGKAKNRRVEFKIQ